MCQQNENMQNLMFSTLFGISTSMLEEESEVFSVQLPR